MRGSNPPSLSSRSEYKLGRTRLWLWQKLLAREQGGVIAHVEVGLYAVDDPERHVVACLVDLRVRPRQRQPALAAAVGDIRRRFVVPANVMLEVASLGGLDECARNRLPVGQGERFVQPLCR